MRVFVTGSSGFIGSAVVAELIGAGHQVLGLVRTDEAAKKVAAAGAKPVIGSLDDLDSLKRGAAESEGIIHTAFVHDFANFAKSCATDRTAIETMASVIKGTNRPFVFATGLAGLNPGHLSTEETRVDISKTSIPRAATEIFGRDLSKEGIRSIAMRLSPSVHDKNDHGFIASLINIAREKGVSAYIGDGANRWPGVHRLDAAKLFRLALEKGEAGAAYHAVGDQGVATREIAETIGRGLKLPVVSKSKDEAQEHFGWITHFFAADWPATSELTQKKLGWKPTEIGLIKDIEANYF